MSINLRDYGRTSEQRGWGKGWPSCSGAKSDTVVVRAARSGAKVSVRRDLSRLVSLLFDATESRGYALKPASTGGYNCRPIGGTKRPSNHSWAVATDLNWNDNPMRRPLTTDMPGWMVDMWARYGFAWGGHYDGTPDPMHFEFMGTPADAERMTALAMRELAGRTAPAQHPAPRHLRLTDPWMRGADVVALQRAIGVADDGIFGPGTDRALRAWQRANRLTDDGIFGPASRRVAGL